MLSADVLTAPQRGAVLSLLETVTRHDGVSPLDEAGRFALTREDARHLLLLADDAEAAEDSPSAVGYAGILADGTIQGMVDPAHRRRGHGTALLEAALAARPDGGVWAHGALEPALGFLTARGLREVRRLLTLHRELGGDRPLAAVPHFRGEGIDLVTFEAERDAEDWVAVNAAAFADHPEQGALRREDLDARIAEPWFSAEDLLLARADDELLGFVWIKREPAPEGAAPEGAALEGAAPEGAASQRPLPEIYAVGTAPAAQGRGIAATLLATALHRLQEDGERGVELYVEADNTAALALYERWGFVISGQDVQLRAHAAESEG